MRKRLGLNYVSLGELRIFSEAGRARSVREAARRMKLEAGQFSKALSSLEKKMGVRLFERSSRGLILSIDGQEIWKHVNDLLSLSEKLDRSDKDFSLNTFTKKDLTLGSLAFVNCHLVAPSAALFEPFAVTLKLVDISPQLLGSYAIRGLFDMTLHVGSMEWPASWYSEKVGMLRWALIARKDHPLGVRAKEEDVLRYPFVGPLYWNSEEGLGRGNDRCPLPQRKRKIQFESSTADSALSIAHSTDHLVFAPEITLKRHAKDFKIIKVKEWKEVAEPLYLAARSSAVPQKLFKSFAQKLGRELP